MKDQTLDFGWLDMIKTIREFLEEKEQKNYLWSNIFLFAASFYNLFPTFMIGLIVDFFHVYKQGDSLKLFYYYTVIWGMTYIVSQLTRLKVKNSLRKIGFSANEKIRIHAAMKLFNTSLEKHTEENMGAKLQRIATGSRAMTEWIKFLDQRFYPILTAVLGIFTVYLYIKPLFSLFLIGYVIIFFHIEKSFSAKDKAANDSCNAAQERSMGYIGDFINNFLTIKALGAEDYVHSIITKYEKEAKKLFFEKADIGTQKRYCFHVLTGVATMIFLLLICRAITKDQISIGMGTVLLSYFSRIKKCANESSTAITEVISIRSDLARIRYLFTAEKTGHYGKSHFPSCWEKINFVDGGYIYQDGSIGLKNVNLILRKGEKLGFKGTSGSGKSTLVTILLGMHRLQTGTLKVDDLGWDAIASDEITANVIVILQSTELFNLSVRENITLCPEEKTDSARLIKALRIADLESLIENLPQGLDTVLKEKGASLSGGERQRINIARAIYKYLPLRSSGILILDEATSSLDEQTEATVVENILREFPESTIIIISHRPAPLKMCDRVIKVEGGTI